MGARETHRVTLWILECGHAVECGCGHTVGLRAHCIMCGKPSKVIQRKRVSYYLQHPRKGVNNSASRR